jgi:hypothetical protein
LDFEVFDAEHLIQETWVVHLRLLLFLSGAIAVCLVLFRRGCSATRYDILESELTHRLPPPWDKGHRKGKHSV